TSVRPRPNGSTGAGIVADRPARRSEQRVRRRKLRRSCGLSALRRAQLRGRFRAVKKLTPPQRTQGFFRAVFAGPRGFPWIEIAARRRGMLEKGVAPVGWHRPPFVLGVLFNPKGDLNGCPSLPVLRWPLRGGAGVLPAGAGR